MRKHKNTINSINHDPTQSSVIIPTTDPVDQPFCATHPEQVRRDAQKIIQNSFSTEEAKFRGQQNQNWNVHIRHFDKRLKCYNVSNHGKLDLFYLSLS